MSNETQNVNITQSNGDQGATSFGPRFRNKASPSKHGNQDVIRTIELQFDGDVQEDQVYDPDNDTQHALPAGCFVLDAYIYSSTGIQALSIGLVDEDGNGADGNLFVGAAQGANWTVARDIDLAVGARSQLVFSGVGSTATGAREVGTAYITFLQTATDAGEDGVLRKPRVVPA